MSVRPQPTRATTVATRRSTRLPSGSDRLSAVLAAGVQQHGRNAATFGMMSGGGSGGGGGAGDGSPTRPSPAELTAQLKAAKEQQQVERRAQLEAARQLTEQAKAVREQARVAREAAKAAHARLTQATREARDRAALEKQAEVERKRLEREAVKEAKEASAAQLVAEQAALRDSKEAAKAARDVAAKEVKEAKDAEKAAKEARRLEEQREREQRDALRRLQQQALAVARAEEASQRAQKRKAETDVKAAKAEEKRQRIRHEKCEETLRQIHLVRDELESVGDRAQELLGKLMSMAGCGADAVDLQWMQALVDEAVRAQELLVRLIESSTMDWRTEQHARVIDEEDDEGSGEDETEDDEGVRVGKFGKLEVVADEDMEADEDGADAFDQEEYKRAMMALRKGRMLPGDLDDMSYDAKA